MKSCFQKKKKGQLVAFFNQSLFYTIQAKNKAFDQILIDWIIMFQFWKKTHKPFFDIREKKTQTNRSHILWLSFWNMFYKYSSWIDILLSHKLCLKMVLWLGLSYSVFHLPMWILYCLMRNHIDVFPSLVDALSSVSDFHKISQAFITLRPLFHL